MTPPKLGALVEPGEPGGSVLFRVWSPGAERLELILERDSLRRPMTPRPAGYHELRLPLADGESAQGPPAGDRIRVGERYRLALDGGEPLPDPASRFQPQGVHGPSEVVDPASYRWREAGWSGIALPELVVYELHVGTFTPEGTFDAARRRLPELARLGVTAVELMPVSDFPGRRGWGYDPAALYAPSRAYGSPRALRRLVDAAHRLGLAVLLDVVYNHFGPDGAYAAAFGPFHTDRHATPWGQAVNLDDEGSQGVRGFYVDNALHWLSEYRFDGLRLDATHALVDDSEPHFLAELAAAVGSLPGPRRLLVAEDERNERRLVTPREAGGFGLDAVWADDFHHQVRNATAGDREGYFADFAETTAADLATTLRQGWYYTGQDSPHLGRPRGTDPTGLARERFVVCIQNHDQVGNRPDGVRLHHEIPPELYRAVSALLLFAPETPLLFMGQEWAASSPFLYFSDHHEELGRLVSEGRRREFADFPGFAGEVPDPQDPATFRRSRLDWEERETPEHAGVLTLYRDLLALRRRLEGDFAVTAHGERGLVLERGGHRLLVALSAGEALPVEPDARLLLDTGDPRYGGPGERCERTGDHILFPTPGAAVFVVAGVAAGREAPE